MTTPAHLGVLAAVTMAGSQSKLARALGLPRQVVGGWVRRGRVPARWVERVAEVTGVPRWQLAPDRFWPAPYVSRKAGL